MNAKDPALGHIKLEFFYGWLVFIFEVCWSIYGSTFIYSEEMDYCKGDKDESAHALILWITALVLICLGYFLIIYLLGVAIFMCFICLTIRAWNKS